MPDPLIRFVTAQSNGTHETALAELRAGQKRTHWMWFIFPQISGLGQSYTARAYAIHDLTEAKAYIAHPLLGPRLTEAAEAILTHQPKSAEAVLGPLDATKLRSSMTLFEAAGGPAVFGQVLDAFYAGERDAATLAFITGPTPSKF